MSRIFALPALLAGAMALALMAGTPTVTSAGEEKAASERGDMGEGMEERPLTEEERKRMEQRIHEIQKDVHRINRELSTLQSRIRAAGPR